MDQDDMSLLALELTCSAVYSEDCLDSYVQQRAHELTKSDLVELVTLLAAIAGATFEGWAEDTDASVNDMLQAMTLYHAVANH